MHSAVGRLCYSAAMPDTPISAEDRAACRPTKPTSELIAAMMSVVNDFDNALIYTDE